TYLYNTGPFKDAVDAAYAMATDGRPGPNDASGNAQNMRQFLYGNAQPTEPSYAKIKAAYIPGEAISAILDFFKKFDLAATGTRPYDFEEKFSDYDEQNSTLGLAGRHTSSQLVALLYGETLGNKAWHQSLQYIWPGWIDDEIAKTIGYKEVNEVRT